MTSRWHLDRHFFRETREKREREKRPKLIIKHIIPEAQMQSQEQKSVLRPVLPNPSLSIYRHVANAGSARILAEIPVEIIDTILSYLDVKECRTLRATHTIFRSSAQARIYHELEFCDFRPPSLCKKSDTAGFFRILEAQPALKTHIKALRLRSLVDPTIQQYITCFLARVLDALGGVRRVTVCFGSATASAKAFVEALGTLGTSLVHPSLAEIHIESSHTSPTMLTELSHLPTTSIKLRHVSAFALPDWRLTLFFDGMAHLPSLRCLDLANLQVSAKWLAHICRKVTNLTDLHMLVPQHTLNADVSDALLPAAPRLRDLSIRRGPRCAFKATYGAPVYLQHLTALRTLSLSTSFLIQPTQCPTPCTRVPAGLIATLDFESPLRNHVPRTLTRLALHFDKPNLLLSRNDMWAPLDPSREEFEGLVGWLNGVGDKSRMAVVELVEGWHCCEMGMGERVCGGRVYDGLEYVFCEGERRVLKNEGLDVRVRVYGQGGMVVQSGDVGIGVLGAEGDDVEAV